jgi:hypothetical protein
VKNLEYDLCNEYVRKENFSIFFTEIANRSSPLSLIIMSEERKKDKDSLLIQSKQGNAIA